MRFARFNAALNGLSQPLTVQVGRDCLTSIVTVLLHCLISLDADLKVPCKTRSPRAVRFARFNAELNGLSHRVSVLQGDLYSALDTTKGTRIPTPCTNACMQGHLAHKKQRPPRTLQ